MTKSLIKLVVGLGNYSLPTTRHSVGMSALNKLADHLGVKWVYEKRCSGFIANYLSEKFQVVLLKPKLAMNINGKSILKAVKTHGVLTDNIILLQDDLDKPVGKLRIKLEGSASGHNGVRSAITSLKTDALFCKKRIDWRQNICVVETQLQPRNKFIHSQA
ncbi:probable peptidyl-tRNA hydrolase isoform X2 [Rhopilema esculentum]|uniref:probable peptidyl-tRNA hydrolase isoform X2 n=1 Tax=Rhopilema esculentum TaxID=499914 RepID=UPI0031D8AA7D